MSPRRGNTLLFPALGLQLEGKLPHQMDIDEWPKAKEQVARAFSTKTQSEWCDTFKDLDACVEPVLSTDEAPIHPHNEERKTFVLNDGAYEPTPAPKLSRTPGNCTPKPQPAIGEHTLQVLEEAGYSPTEIQQLINDGVIECSNMKSSL